VPKKGASRPTEWNASRKTRRQQKKRSDQHRGDRTMPDVARLAGIRSAGLVAQFSITAGTSGQRTAPLCRDRGGVNVILFESGQLTKLGRTPSPHLGPFGEGVTGR